MRKIIKIFILTLLSLNINYSSFSMTINQEELKAGQIVSGKTTLETVITEAKGKVKKDYTDVDKKIEDLKKSDVYFETKDNKITVKKDLNTKRKKELKNKIIEILNIIKKIKETPTKKKTKPPTIKKLIENAEKLIKEKKEAGATEEDLSATEKELEKINQEYTAGTKRTNTEEKRKQFQEIRKQVNQIIITVQETKGTSDRKKEADDLIEEAKEKIKILEGKILTRMQGNLENAQKKLNEGDFESAKTFAQKVIEAAERAEQQKKAEGKDKEQERDIFAEMKKVEKKIKTLPRKPVRPRRGKIFSTKEEKQKKLEEAKRKEEAKKEQEQERLKEEAEKKEEQEKETEKEKQKQKKLEKEKKEREFRTHQERQRFLKKKEAAIKIQAAERGRQERKKFLEKKEAATKIQSTFRMHQERQRFLRQKKAAIKIQRLIRTRKAAKEKREEEDRAQEETKRKEKEEKQRKIKEEAEDKRNRQEEEKRKQEEAKRKRKEAAEKIKIVKKEEKNYLTTFLNFVKEIDVIAKLTSYAEKVEKLKKLALKKGIPEDSLNINKTSEITNENIETLLESAQTFIQQNEGELLLNSISGADLNEDEIAENIKLLINKIAKAKEKEAKKKEEEERLKQEEAERKRLESEEAKRKEEETKRQKEEDDRLQKEETERLIEEAVAAEAKEEEAAKLKEEDEAAKLKEEEEEERLKQEEEEEEDEKKLLEWAESKTKEKKEEAATKIQRIFRGYKSRKETTKLKEAKTIKTQIDKLKLKTDLNFTQLNELQKEVNKTSVDTDYRDTIKDLIQNKDYFADEPKISIIDEESPKSEKNYTTLLNELFKKKVDELIKEKSDKLGKTKIETFEITEENKEKFENFKTKTTEIKKLKNDDKKVIQLKDFVLKTKVPKGLYEKEENIEKYSKWFEVGLVKNISSENIKELLKEAKAFIKKEEGKVAQEKAAKLKKEEEELLQQLEKIKKSEEQKEKQDEKTDLEDQIQKLQLKPQLNFTKLNKLQEEIDNITTDKDNQKAIQNLTKTYFTTEIKGLKFEDNYKQFLNQEFKKKANGLITEKIKEFNNMVIKIFDKTKEETKYSTFEASINEIKDADDVSEKVRKLKDAVLYNGIPEKLKTATAWMGTTYAYPVWAKDIKIISDIKEENIEKLLDEAKLFIGK